MPWRLQSADLSDPNLAMSRPHTIGAVSDKSTSLVTAASTREFEMMVSSVVSAKFPLILMAYVEESVPYHSAISEMYSGVTLGELSQLTVLNHHRSFSLVNAS